MRAGVVALAIAAVGCDEVVPSQPPPEVVERTAAERGAEVFDDPGASSYPFNAFACSTCHDAAARGDVLRPGVPLAGAVDRPSYWGGGEIDLLRAVDQCLARFMLEDQVWTGEEDTARSLYAFLESLPATAADKQAAPYTFVVAIEDVPVGDAGRGEVVFGRACATCHGAPHTGAGKLVDFAAVLPDDALAAHPLGEYTAVERRLVVVEKVRHGGFLGYGGQMPPFSREELDDAALGDLLSFFGL